MSQTLGWVLFLYLSREYVWFACMCVCVFFLHNAVLGYSPPGFSPELHTSCDGDPLICICQQGESESCSVEFDSLQPHGLHGILQAIILEWVAFPLSLKEIHEP